MRNNSPTSSSKYPKIIKINLSTVSGKISIPFNTPIYKLQEQMSSTKHNKKPTSEIPNYYQSPGKYQSRQYIPRQNNKYFHGLSSNSQEKRQNGNFVDPEKKYRTANQQTRPNMLKSKQKSKSKNKSKITSFYQQKNCNYEKPEEIQLKYKKSLQKLKKTFFGSNVNTKSKRTTVKTLKQIGKYALERYSKIQSRRKSNQRYIQLYKERFEKQKLKVVIVQNISKENWIKLREDIYYEENKNNKHKSRVKIQEEILYVDFEEEYKKILEQNTYKHNILSIQQQRQPEYDEQDQTPILEEQIDLICEIFNLCDIANVDEQSMNIHQMYRLLEQLERLFFLKAIQKDNIVEETSLSRSEQSEKESLLGKMEQLYYKLLKELEESFKVVFYRKQNNNIYDVLFYLKDSNRLQKICRLFKQIKKIIQL